MIPHKCPVCLGTGNVPGGFYQCCPGGTPCSANAYEPCKSCVNGVVWECEPIVITPGTTSGGQNATFQWHTYKGDENSILGSINIVLNKILKAIKGQGKNV